MEEDGRVRRGDVLRKERWAREEETKKTTKRNLRLTMRNSSETAAVSLRRKLRGVERETSSGEEMGGKAEKREG
jgi:hypothetical protein